MEVVNMARGGKGRTYQSTNLWCKECGNVSTIRRSGGRKKELLHVKHMYCPNCKETTAHLENLEEYAIKKYGFRININNTQDIVVKNQKTGETLLHFGPY